MTIWEIITQAYDNYASYLWKELTHPFKPSGNYFYWLIAASLFAWALELLIPWRKKQAAIRSDFWVDGFYMFFNYFLFNLLIYAALSSVTEHYFKNLMAGIGLPKNGLTNLAVLPFWLQLIVFFLIADFVQWFIHVQLHKWPRLWRVHQVHHSVTEMGFAAHLRYHWVETLVYQSGKYIILAWLFHFELGNAFLLHAFTTLIGHLNHTNVAWDYGPLKYLFNNPKMHIWHHAKELPDEHPNGVNFGITLSIWDYLFGTAWVPKDGRDIALGFPDIEHYPKRFFSHLIEPFRKSRK